MCVGCQRRRHSTTTLSPLSKPPIFDGIAMGSGSIMDDLILPFSISVVQIHSSEVVDIAKTVTMNYTEARMTIRLRTVSSQLF